MRNEILNSFENNSDFTSFINTHFIIPNYKITKNNSKFPPNYEKGKTPESYLKTIPESEAEKIIQRELIRENTFRKHNFDIFEFPFTVFYENADFKEVLKPFKTEKEAKKFSIELLQLGYFSLLIYIMNHDIECQLFKD